MWTISLIDHLKSSLNGTPKSDLEVFKKNSLKPLLTTSSWNKIRCFQVFSFSSSMVFCRRFVDPNNKKRELTTPKKKNTLHVTLSQSPPPKKKTKQNFVEKKSTLSSAVSQVSGTLDSHTSLLFICSSVCETCITCSLCWDNSSLANPRWAKWLLKKPVEPSE